MGSATAVEYEIETGLECQDTGICWRLRFIETGSWALVLLAIGVRVLLYEKNADAGDGENGQQAH